MVSVENQFDDVLFGHLGELPGEDIFQVNQHLERVSLLIILNDFENDFSALLLHLRAHIPVDKTQPYVLFYCKVTSPFMPTKLFLSSSVACIICKIQSLLKICK